MQGPSQGLSSDVYTGMELNYAVSSDSRSQDQQQQASQQASHLI